MRIKTLRNEDLLNTPSNMISMVGVVACVMREKASRRGKNGYYFGDERSDPPGMFLRKLLQVAIKPRLVQLFDWIFYFHCSLP
jgi:hypothetical protein